MTSPNDREAEMAMGSTWATTASDQPTMRRGDIYQGSTSDGTSSNGQDGSNGAHPVDTSHDAANGGSGTPPAQGGSTTDDGTHGGSTAGGSTAGGGTSDGGTSGGGSTAGGTDDGTHGGSTAGGGSTPGDGSPTGSHSGDVAGIPGSVLPGLQDTIPSLDLAGDHGALQPVLNVVNTAAQDVHSVVGSVGEGIGLSGAVDGLGNLLGTIGLGNIGTVAHADGHTNLLTDVLNAPGDVLNGDLGGVLSHLGADLSDTVNATTGLVGSVLGGNDAANPLGNVISDLGHDLQTLPLLNINGGNNANDGGLLGGSIGNLNASSSGHLLGVDVGPESSNGQAINLLAQPEAGPHHALEVNVVDTTPGSLQLADLGLLTGAHGLNIPALDSSGLGGSGLGGSGLGGSGLNIPNLGGAGADGLTGHLLGTDGLLGNLGGGILNGPIASGNTANAPVNAPINIDAVHDLVNAPLVTDHGILDTHGSHIL